MTSVIVLLWDNFASSLSTITSAILISLRQSEIATRRYKYRLQYVFNVSNRLDRIGSV
jgi:hypothetical protein